MRKPGPRVKCPSCGRVVGSYFPAIPVTVGAVRVIRHRRMSYEEMRRHKSSVAMWCPGGEVTP